MCVHQVGVAGRSSRRARVGSEKRRHQREAPGRSSEVLSDAVSVGDPEMSERRGRDDLDVDAERPHSFHGIANEVAGDVPRVPRVRRREHDDLHGSRGAKTTGIASDSAMNA